MARSLQGEIVRSLYRPKNIPTTLSGTSSTLVTITSSGSVTFETAEPLSFQPGFRLKAISESTGYWIEGVVVSNSGTEIEITADLSSGSGNLNDWLLGPTGTLPEVWLSYTPAVSSTGGSYSATAQGRFIKFGTIVHVRFRWSQIASADDSATGAFTVELPFESVSDASTIGAQWIGLASGGVPTAEALIGTVDSAGTLCTITALDRTLPVDHLLYEMTGFYEVDYDAELL